ncbi:MAG: hypothetical protein FWD92_05515 [Methanomassiliicoccaceae archaeon]|nr:hypothetical protein [Methanomassiliicoccaceae archaeon]
MDRIWALMAVIISFFSLALGIWKQDGSMMALSATAILFSVASYIYCSNGVYVYALVMSVTVLICTALMVTVTSYDSLVATDTVSEHVWICLSAVIRGAAVIPMIIMFFFVVAAIFKASYNRVTAPILCWAVGMGILLPMYVTILFVQRADLNDGIIVNATLVIGMFIKLLMFIALSLILRSVLKKNNCLITDKGFEVMK